MTVWYQPFQFCSPSFLAQCLNKWQMAEMKNNLKYHFSAPRIYQCQPRMGTKRCRTADERIIVESKIIKTSQEARNFWVICSRGCVFKDLLTETMKSEKSEVAQSCPTPCDPMDYGLLGSSVCRIFQARMLKWVAISFSRGIFLTQGLNPGLPHCRRTLYRLS